jgi:O-antigen/teichoic acid export membrane protein
MSDAEGRHETDSLWRGRVPLRGDRTIRQHAARGSIINGAYLIGLNMLAVVRTFLVAGFLTAADYGLWSILAVAVGTLVWFKQIGVSDKYIQQDEEDQEAAFQKAFTIELVVNGIFFVVMAAAIPLVAVVYGQPELIPLGYVTILALVPSAFTAPLWVFYRRMQFGTQRLIQGIDPVVGTVVAVGLAIAGAGYWALAGGLLAGAYAAGIAAVLMRPYPLRLRYDKSTLREYFRFSWPLFFEQLASVMIAQTAILVGEWQLGLAGVGALALANIIAQYTDRIDEVVTGTLYPAICGVRDRLDLLFETFVKSNRLALMWGIPFGVGVALFAADLVHFGLGDQWVSAIGVIQAFGLIAAANHIGFNWSAFFRARGNTRPMAVVSTLMMLACFAAVVPLTITEGLEGYIAGMVVVAATGLVGRSWYLSRLFDGLAMLRHALRATAPTVPAVAIIAALRAVESGSRSLPLALAELTLYLSVTACATVLLERPLLREALSYFRRIQSPGHARVAA